MVNFLVVLLLANSVFGLNESPQVYCGDVNIGTILGSDFPDLFMDGEKAEPVMYYMKKIENVPFDRPSGQKLLNFFSSNSNCKNKMKFKLVQRWPKDTTVCFMTTGKIQKGSRGDSSFSIGKIKKGTYKNGKCK